MNAKPVGMTRTARRICLLVHSLQPGGMERVMSELANYISNQNNIEVHIILYGIKRDIFYSLSDSVIIHRPPFKFHKWFRMFSTLRTMLFLREKVKEINPVNILSFGEYWNNLVLLSLKNLNYPVFISDRSQPGKNLGFFHNFLKKWLYPGAKGYIAQTRQAELIARSQKLNENIQVIGNPISRVLSEPGIPKEKIVLTVGRLINTKHFDHLINMFVEIAQPEWKLVIVGGDAKKQKLSTELNKLIKRLGAVDKVILKGTQENIHSIYSRSSIFAMTSSSEGFPNVIGEAQSAGLPVIAFNCTAGPSDLINDGVNGFLVDLFDFESFKNKLRLLMNDEELRNRLGDQAKEDVRKFDRERICAEFLDFIQGEVRIPA